MKQGCFCLILESCNQKFSLLISAKRHRSSNCQPPLLLDQFFFPVKAVSLSHVGHFQTACMFSPISLFVFDLYFGSGELGLLSMRCTSLICLMYSSAFAYSMSSHFCSQSSLETQRKAMIHSCNHATKSFQDAIQKNMPHPISRTKSGKDAKSH